MDFLIMLKNRFTDKMCKVAYFLVSVFCELIEEFDFTKGYEMLISEIGFQIEMTDLLFPIQDLLCDIIICAMYAANMDAENAAITLDALKIDAYDLGLCNLDRKAFELWKMPEYLPRIVGKLTRIWQSESGKTTIKNPRAFYFRLYRDLLDMSTDIYVLTGGRVMLLEDDEY